MELDLNKGLLLSFLSILALSFPCRAATWPPGRNLSSVAAASLPCGVGEAGCRIADLRPELEGIADPGMLGASLEVSGTGSTEDPNSAGCGRLSQSGKYTPCTTEENPQPSCDVFCRNCAACVKK